jgi:hypothetical protein
VAGILSAKRDFHAPAICPDCTLLIRSIFTDRTSGREQMPIATPRELAAAIIECIDANARIINLSLGLTHLSTQSERVLEEALGHAVRHGVIVVAPTGARRETRIRTPHRPGTGNSAAGAGAVSADSAGVENGRLRGYVPAGAPGGRGLFRFPESRAKGSPCSAAKAECVCRHNSMSAGLSLSSEIRPNPGWSESRPAKTTTSDLPCLKFRTRPPFVLTLQVRGYKIRSSSLSEEQFPTVRERSTP